MVIISNKKTVKLPSISSLSDIEIQNKSPIGQIFDTPTEMDTEREIVLEFLNTEKNLDEKTDLDKPMQWTLFRTLEGFLDNLGLKNSSTVLKKFIDQSHKHKVSFKRQGRTEIIELIRALNHAEKEKTELKKISDKIST